MSGAAWRRWQQRHGYQPMMTLDDPCHELIIAALGCVARCTEPAARRVDHCGLRSYFALAQCLCHACALCRLDDMETLCLLMVSVAHGLRFNTCIGFANSNQFPVHV